MSHHFHFSFFKRHSQRQDAHSRGQGMVEFALALPVLLLLVMGVIEFGRLLMTYSAVFSAAREASRYGAAVGANTLGVPFDHDCDGMRAAAVRVGALGGVKTDSIAIRMLGPDGQPKQISGSNVGDGWCTANNIGYATVLGDIVEVTVAVSYAPVVPLVPIPQLSVSGNSGGVRSTSSRTIVTDVQVPSTSTGGGGTPITYTLNINYVPADSTGGTVTPSTAVNNPDVGPYTAGTVVHLTPNAAPGWHFTGWTGPDGGQVDGSNNITIDMSKTVTANFVQDPYALVISSFGSGTVSPVVGSYLHAPGSLVTLNATPANGWTFKEWSGTDVPSGTNSTSYTILMDKAKNIMATFTNSQKYNLTTNITGTGTVSPPNGQYTFGDTLQMIATPGDGCWSFTTFRVNGGSAISQNPLPVTIGGDTNVQANFQSAPFTLTAIASTNPTGVNGGSLTLDPPGGSYPCDAAGRTVTLTAHPQPGWTFIGWTGVDASNGLTATVNLSQSQPNRTVTGIFNLVCILNASANPPEGGTIALDPPGGSYACNTAGTPINLTASPAPGWAFTGWSGVDSSASTSALVTLTTAQPNRSVIGSFIQVYPVTAIPSPADGGMVTPDSQIVARGSSATVTATPNTFAGYKFDSWIFDPSYAATLNGAEITFTNITGPRTVTAKFVAYCAPKGLIATSNPTLVGTTGLAAINGTATWQISNNTAMDVNITNITISSFTSSDDRFDVLEITSATLNGLPLWSGTISGKQGDYPKMMTLTNLNTLVPVSHGTPSTLVFNYTYKPKKTSNVLSLISISPNFSNGCTQ